MSTVSSYRSTAAGWCGDVMSADRERLESLVGLEDISLELVSSDIEPRDGYVLERLRFRLPDSTEVRGFLTRPPGDGVIRPAILYAHAHGGRYEIGASELTEGRPALLNAPGPVLARAGYATLCIDMPTFGERSGIKEDAAAKAALWYGRTLFGQMLSEQKAALSWLSARPDVDPRRIGMTGISMGATLSYFLAALDQRIAAIAHLCCYADFGVLVETGAHDLHGHYLTIPGLLAATSIGRISGLVSPRPQLVCIGLRDPLTPLRAVEVAFAETVAAYRTAPDALSLLTVEDAGHRETASMRDAVTAFFAAVLRPLP
jgi:hypothetical protein